MLTILIGTLMSSSKEGEGGTQSNLNTSHSPSIRAE